MINFDEKFWLAIAFLTFAIFIFKKVGPLLSKALDDQSEAIAKELKDAKELKEKATKLLEDAEKFSSESKNYAEKLLKDAEIEAQKFTDNSQRLIEEEIAKKTNATIERIKIEEESAIRKLKEQIITSTISNLSNNLSEKLTNQHQDHLIQEATKKIDNA